jgi:hypothetical protein
MKILKGVMGLNIVARVEWDDEMVVEALENSERFGNANHYCSDGGD